MLILAPQSIKCCATLVISQLKIFLAIYYQFTIANCYLLLIIFILFPVAPFFFILFFFFSFSSSLSLVALSNQSSFLQSSPLSRSNQTHSLSHLRSNSHHIFVGLFKVDHVVSLFVAVTTWVKLCWSQWWWVNLWRWWWVVMVWWVVAVEMGSNWVVGCCGSRGLLIRPQVVVRAGPRYFGA